MSDNTRERKERIAREEGYESFDSAPAAARRNISWIVENDHGSAEIRMRSEGQ